MHGDIRWSIGDGQRIGPAIARHVDDEHTESGRQARQDRLEGKHARQAGPRTVNEQDRLSMPAFRDSGCQPVNGQDTGAKLHAGAHLDSSRAAPAAQVAA